MKFALNGALTIGTLDGANIEIREAVGAENFFLFGLTADEVVGAASARATGRARLRAQPGAARRCSTSIASGFFSPEDPDLFRPLVDALLADDRYMLLADFGAYVDAQDAVARPTPTPTPGRGRPSSTSPGWAASPPTAPSASTPATSGASRRSQ